MSEQVDTQFSSREVPWMKLGKLVDEPVTAAEAAELGGLNFSVSLQDVAWIGFGNEGNLSVSNVVHPILNRKAVIADDNGDFMGFVSSKIYNPLQYAEAFNFMDTVGTRYVAAGALRGRRQGFMVIKPNVQLNVLGGEDKHELFAVLRTSHDCSRGIEISAMPLRHRCMNQLTLRSFTRGVDYRWSVKHNTTMHAKLHEAQESLKKLGLYVKRFEEVADRLANIELKEGQARNVLKIVIPQPTAGKTERTQIQWEERIASILGNWQTSPTVAYAGTGWGLVNAVSEYFDWHRTGGTAESRFLNALEGETHKKINKLTGVLLSTAS